MTRTETNSRTASSRPRTALRVSSPTYAKIAPKAKGQLSLKDLRADALPRFVKAIGRHRHHERETDPPGV